MDTKIQTYISNISSS